MKSSHCEDKQENRPLDILTDEENGLRIIVSRLGGPDQSCENKRSRRMEWTVFSPGMGTVLGPDRSSRTARL